MTNLLTNARKYTPAGTTVTVAVQPDGFDVHDDGPGFPPDLVPIAFERFARADASRAAARAGSGSGSRWSRRSCAPTAARSRSTSEPGDTTIASCSATSDDPCIDCLTILHAAKEADHEHRSSGTTASNAGHHGSGRVRARRGADRAQLPPAAGRSRARRGCLDDRRRRHALPRPAGRLLRAQLRPRPPAPARGRALPARPADADQPRVRPRPVRATSAPRSATSAARTWCCR